MAWYENAISAKIKCRYGRRLTQAQYDELTHKKSIQEIAMYLKERTPYSVTLDELHEGGVRRELLESMLQRDIIYEYARLVRYAGNERGVYDWLIKDLEIDLILKCLREMFYPITADAVAGIPMFVQDYISFDILKMAGIKSVDELLEFLSDTPYDAIISECRDRRGGQTRGEFYVDCEMAMQLYRYNRRLDDIKKHMSAHAREQLEDFVRTDAELHNLKIIYRVKAAFKLDVNELSRRMIPVYGAIPPQKLNKMVRSADLDAFMKLLKQTRYGAAVSGEGMFEDELNRFYAGRQQRVMRFATDPQVIFAVFRRLHRTEVENLTRIIEGVRYGLEAARIKELLCIP